VIASEPVAWFNPRCRSGRRMPRLGQAACWAHTCLMEDEWSGELVVCEWCGEPVRSGGRRSHVAAGHRSDYERRATAEVVSLMPPAARLRERRPVLSPVGAEERRRALKFR
jgi:hypothetical protein